MTDTRDTTYNGWTNSETWNCNLRFDGCFTEQAEELYKAANDCDVFSKAENAAALLADYIKDFVEMLQPELSNGFYADVLNAALREVNYYEISKHYIDELKLAEEA